MPTMVREAWTDERLDDLTKHMDEGFREVRTELRQQREENAAEFAAVRSQITTESASLRKEFAEVREALGEQQAEIKGLEKTMDAKFEKVDARFEKVDARFDDVMRATQIGFGIIGSVLAVITAMLVGVLGLIATQL